MAFYFGLPSPFFVGTPSGIPVAGTDRSVALLAAWVAAVVANGGSVSAGRQTIVQTFIQAELATNNWDLTDDYWVLWAENSQQALTSLKQLRLATVTAAPTFTTDRGYAFNGTTQFIDTGFICGTHGRAMSFGNLRMGVYQRTNVNSNTTSMGATQTGGSQFRLVARNSTVMNGQNQTTGTSNFTLSPADSLAFRSSSRSGNGTTSLGYQRGVALTPATGVTPAGTALPDFSLYISALNNLGTASNFGAFSMGMTCVGAPLSAAQELAQYTAVQAWATSIGANV